MPRFKIGDVIIIRHHNDNHNYLLVRIVDFDATNYTNSYRYKTIATYGDCCIDGMGNVSQDIVSKYTSLSNSNMDFIKLSGKDLEKELEKALVEIL